MTGLPHRFRAAIERFDAANAADPNREPDAAGAEPPRERLYAQRMSKMRGQASGGGVSATRAVREG